MLGAAQPAAEEDPRAAEEWVAPLLVAVDSETLAHLTADRAGPGGRGVPGRLSSYRATAAAGEASSSGTVPSGNPAIPALENATGEAARHFRTAIDLGSRLPREIDAGGAPESAMADLIDLEGAIMDVKGYMATLDSISDTLLN